MLQEYIYIYTYTYTCTCTCTYIYVYIYVYMYVYIPCIFRSMKAEKGSILGSLAWALRVPGMSQLPGSRRSGN